MNRKGLHNADTSNCKKFSHIENREINRLVNSKSKIFLEIWIRNFSRKITLE